MKMLRQSLYLSLVRILGLTRSHVNGGPTGIRQLSSISTAKYETYSNSQEQVMNSTSTYLPMISTNEETSANGFNATIPFDPYNATKLMTFSSKTITNFTSEGFPFNDTDLRLTSTSSLSTKELPICSHNAEKKCAGDRCNRTTCPLKTVVKGMYQLPSAKEVTGCVGEDQTVYIVCDRGYEVISGSAMAVMELMCADGVMSMSDAELCVPVCCDFPYDWLKFTDWEQKKFKDYALLSFPYETHVMVKCWIADQEFNWSYLLECKADGSWSGSHVLSMDDCQVPHKESPYMGNVKAAKAVGSSAGSVMFVGLRMTSLALMVTLAAP